MLGVTDGKDVGRSKRSKTAASVLLLVITVILLTLMTSNLLTFVSKVFNGTEKSETSPGNGVTGDVEQQKHEPNIQRQSQCVRYWAFSAICCHKSSPLANCSVPPVTRRVTQKPRTSNNSSPVPVLLETDRVNSLDGLVPTVAEERCDYASRKKKGPGQVDS